MKTDLLGHRSIRRSAHRSLTSWHGSRWVAVGFALLFGPYFASACTPVPPIFFLLSGAGTFENSKEEGLFLGITIAATIKSISFCLLERRVQRGQALCWMLIANIVSTVPGFIICTFGITYKGAQVLGATLLGIILIFRIWSLMRGKIRAILLTLGVMLAYCIFFITACVMFYEARHMELHNHVDASAYWPRRLLCVTLLAVAGIGISAALEEACIALFLGRKLGIKSFYRSVIRSNYITLGIILLWSAVKVVPERLRDPQFLTTQLAKIASSHLAAPNPVLNGRVEESPSATVHTSKTHRFVQIE